jgi:hypothetical protein
MWTHSSLLPSMCMCHQRPAKNSSSILSIVYSTCMLCRVHKHHKHKWTTLKPQFLLWWTNCVHCVKCVYNIGPVENHVHVNCVPRVYSFCMLCMCIVLVPKGMCTDCICNNELNVYAIMSTMCSYSTSKMTSLKHVESLYSSLSGLDPSLSIATEHASGRSL